MRENRGKRRANSDEITYGLTKKNLQKNKEIVVAFFF